MTTYRDNLPQLTGTPMLTDGGLETTLIFQQGLDLPCFAAFHLLVGEHLDLPGMVVPGGCGAHALIDLVAVTAWPEVAAYHKLRLRRVVVVAYRAHQLDGGAVGALQCPPVIAEALAPVGAGAPGRRFQRARCCGGVRRWRA